MNRAVPPTSSDHGITPKVDGSGSRIMSDSKISRNPRTDEPSSFGTPVTNASSSIVCDGTWTWLNPPKRSV